MARGTKHIRFNSSPSQAKGQDLPEITASVPKIVPINISLTKIKMIPLVSYFAAIKSSPPHTAQSGTIVSVARSRDNSDNITTRFTRHDII